MLALGLWSSLVLTMTCPVILSNLALFAFTWAWSSFSIPVPVHDSIHRPSITFVISIAVLTSFYAVFLTFVVVFESLNIVSLLPNIVCINQGCLLTEYQ